MSQLVPLKMRQCFYMNTPFLEGQTYKWDDTVCISCVATKKPRKMKVYSLIVTGTNSK